MARVSKLEAVQNVRSPLEEGNAGQISENGHAALVEFEIRGEADEAADKIDPVLAAVDDAQQAHPQFFIGEFGYASASDAVNTAAADDLAKAGELSLPITLVILVIAFGALVAAGIPLLLALTAVIATFGIVGVVSQAVPVATQGAAIVLLIGLAVGVDYSLFYLRREREERAAGRSERAALEIAAATSGRAVLISGLTVMTAMAGMFLTGDKIFASFGIATILVVAIAMLGSLTVLPALLSRLGDGVDRVRVPLVGRLRRDDGEGRIWGAIIDRVLRRPLLSAVLAGGFLLVLALPAIQLRMVQPGVDTFPKSLPAIQAYDRMQQAFPGTALPASVVVKAPDVNGPAMQAAIRRLERLALASGRMHEPITVDVNDGGNGREHHHSDRGQGNRRRLERLPRHPARRDRAGNRRRASRRRSRRHGAHRAVEGRRGRDEVEPAARGRVRALVRVRADARRLPLARDRGQGDPAQPALGRCRLRRAGARLPARRRQGLPGLRLDGRHRPGGPTAAVRDPVRALDGLPRVPAEPDPRGACCVARPPRRRSRTGSSRPPVSSRVPRS